MAESITEPYTMSRDPWSFVAGTPEAQARVDAALAGLAPAEDGYTRQFELFHAALEAGTEPPVTLADARASLELVTAAYQSAAQRPAGFDADRARPPALSLLAPLIIGRRRPISAREPTGMPG